MWSNFCERDIILAAKFWTFCPTRPVLKTSALITFNNVFLSKRCFTLLIWLKLDKQHDVTFVTLVICSSKRNVASINTPRSAETTGRNSFPSKVTCKSRSAGVFWSIWRVPIKSNFALSGLIRRLFWQHHAATFLRSSDICRAAPSISLTKNDRSNLESST